MKKRYSRLPQHCHKYLHSIYMDLYVDIINYETNNILPFRNKRDSEIKRALKSSIFKLLKIEKSDGSKLLKAYRDIDNTFEHYKYAIEIYYVKYTNLITYLPYENIIEELEFDPDLLIKILDSAWSYITNTDMDNFIFQDFKSNKDRIIIQYIINSKDNRVIKEQMIDNAVEEYFQLLSDLN